MAVVPRSRRLLASARRSSLSTWSLAVAARALHFRPELSPRWVVRSQSPGRARDVLAVRTRRSRAAALCRRRSRAESVERARFRALRVRAGSTQTQRRTGMLILISELEHRVVILGDSGIHERVGDAGWQAHVDHIVPPIRRGEAVRGVLEVIERLGRLHAELKPRARGRHERAPRRHRARADGAARPRRCSLLAHEACLRAGARRMRGGRASTSAASRASNVIFVL